MIDDRSALPLGNLWAQQREPEIPIGESEWTYQKPRRGQRAGRGRSCLPLALLLIVSAWALVVFGATVARAVS